MGEGLPSPPLADPDGGAPEPLLSDLAGVEVRPEDHRGAALGLAPRVARERVREPEHAEVLLPRDIGVAAAQDQPLAVGRVLLREVEHRRGETPDRVARAALERLERIGQILSHHNFPLRRAQGAAFPNGYILAHPLPCCAHGQLAATEAVWGFVFLSPESVLASKNCPPSKNCYFVKYRFLEEGQEIFSYQILVTVLFRFSESSYQQS